MIISVSSPKITIIVENDIETTKITFNKPTRYTLSLDKEREPTFDIVNYGYKEGLFDTFLGYLNIESDIPPIIIKEIKKETNE